MHNIIVQSIDDEKYLDEAADLINSHSINITEEQMFDLLKIRRRWGMGSIETINACGRVSCNYFTTDGTLNFSEWKKLYDLGFTSYINEVMDLTEELRTLDTKLFDLKGSYTSANLYFAKGSTTHRVSFPPHNHDYHVIVKPIYGSCTWLIGDQVQYVTPDDLVILPCGTMHTVLESTEPRLSLTINLTG